MNGDVFRTEFSEYFSGRAGSATVLDNLFSGAFQIFTLLKPSNDKLLSVLYHDGRI